MPRKRTGYIQDRESSFRIAYYDVNGIRRFETYKTREQAARELANRLAEVANGMPVSADARTILFGQLAADVITNYRINGFKSLDDIEARFRLHIIPVFGKRKARDITTAHLNAYVEMRQAEEPRPSLATINRELEAIRHTFRLARTHGRIVHMPHVPHFKEHNTRTGFFTRAEVDALCSKMPKPYSDFVLFGFLTAWRYGEIQSLLWRNVDFAAGEIRLDPGTTKNGEARVFPMFPELRLLLERNRPVTAVDRLKIQHVFSVKTWRIDPKTNRRVLSYGPIGAFRKTWKRACHDSGLPCVVDKDSGRVLKTLRIFHDLRRSGVREIIHHGIPERVAMDLAGMKTRSVLDRYHIVSEADLRDAAAKLGSNGAAKRAETGVQEAKSNSPDVN